MTTDIIALAKELKEAREKATQGEWEFTHSADKRRGSIIVENKLEVCYYDPVNPWCHKGIKVKNFDFIALAANKAHILAEACIIMAEALELAEELLPVPEHHQDEEWFEKEKKVYEALEKVRRLK